MGRIEEEVIVCIFMLLNLKNIFTTIPRKKTSGQANAKVHEKNKKQKSENPKLGLISGQSFYFSTPAMIMFCMK